MFKYIFTPGAVQVADMRRNHHPLAPCQRYRVLHVAARRQQRSGQFRGKFEFQRRRAAPGPDGPRLSRHGADNRVVRGADDGTVVVQEGVRHVDGPGEQAPAVVPQVRILLQLLGIA